MVEHGCVEGAPGQKARWFADAAGVAKAWPELIALSYNHETGHSGKDANMNYRIDTSQASIAGFRAMGASSFFNPSQIFYSRTGSTTPPAGGRLPARRLPATCRTVITERITPRPTASIAARTRAEASWSARLSGGSLGA